MYLREAVNTLCGHLAPTIAVVLSFAYLFLTGSIFFDLVHYISHRYSKSSIRFIQFLVRAHKAHHLYFDRQLKFNDKYRWQNNYIALPLELACQLAGSLLGWISAPWLKLAGPGWVNKELLGLVFTCEIVRTLFVIYQSGRDANHISYNSLPKDPHYFLVGPHYHALHHIDPKRYFSSMVRLIDWLLGTAYCLKKKRVTMTGGNGAFGRAMEKKLKQEKVACVQKLVFGKDWGYGDYKFTLSILAETDVLILAHGSKGENALRANCDSVIDLITLFLQHRKQLPGKVQCLPEVWYIGSEIEFHPSWGLPELQRYSHSKRSFLPYARRFYDDPSFLYRHIVPAVFHSRMGLPILSADSMASISMWWIRRGARYVPATYTGLAYANYFKFIYWIKPKGATMGKGKWSFL